MRFYLGIGSNIDAANNIRLAKQAMRDKYPTIRFSRTFESQAVGFEGDNFLNLVAAVDSDVSLPSLLESLKQLETSLGRVRGGEKFASRHIDIDILLYGDLQCLQPVELPRPEIRENAYVLWPLAELAGDLIEPGGTQTYAELWQAFDRTRQILKPIE